MKKQKTKTSLDVAKSVRKPMPPPTSAHKDRKKYTRKQKHKKGWD